MSHNCVCITLFFVYVFTPQAIHTHTRTTILTNPIRKKSLQMLKPQLYKTRNKENIWESKT